MSSWLVPNFPELFIDEHNRIFAVKRPRINFAVLSTGLPEKSLQQWYNKRDVHALTDT